MSTPGAPSTSTAAATSGQKITIPDFAELYQANFLDTLLPPSKDEEYHIINPATPTPQVVKNEMMEALKGTSHQTFTANNAPAFNSTLSATLDAFNGLTSGTYGSTVTQLLNNAWKEDSAITLRLIWSLRSIHNGKGEREVFYRSFGWLYDNHPRTAIANLHLLVDPVCEAPGGKKIEGLAHGYWKDLLNILALATVDELSEVANRPGFLHHPRQKIGWEKKLRLKSKKRSPPSNAAVSLTHIKEAEEKAAKIKKTAKESRDDRQTKRHTALLKKLEIPKFRALYIAVARLFADRLGKDIKLLDEIKALGPDDKNRILLVKQLSLAGKWAPTPGCSHDLVTNIATAISLLVHSSQIFTSYPASLTQPSTTKQEHALILRSFYQRWVLTELRQGLTLPEPFMATNRWNEIHYNRVPSLSMKLNTPNFFKHDPEGFEKYLISVEEGKKTISGATLLPHTLVSQVVSLHTKVDKKSASNLAGVGKELASTQLRVVEAQWKTLIESVRSSGTLDNCIAVCDVSGSMGFLSNCGHQKGKKDENVSPIVPAIALSLVLATVAKPPFNAGFITFSSQPAFVTLDLTKSLYDQVMELSKADWGMNTDINAVFMKLLLPLAVKNKIPQDQMIKRLFVFSDMQFDDCQGSSAAASNWQTNYDVIEKAYHAAGYEVPQIVYWDLAHSGGTRTVEVEGDRKGVAMMNGFSPALLKVFMGETDLNEVSEWEKVTEDGESKTVVDDQFTPVNVMRKALTHSSFDKLQILD